jgi:glycosyltransferase involved in cell wall biosynthesis
VERAFAGAACVASASEREGYGLIVVEAAARGTPSVVVAGEENASVELVVPGVNGVVAIAPTPEAIGSAIVDVVRSGAALRQSTLRWFVDNANQLRIDRSLELVLESYKKPPP